jgi:hypothetical protein
MHIHVTGKLNKATTEKNNIVEFNNRQYKIFECWCNKCGAFSFLEFSTQPSKITCKNCSNIVYSENIRERIKK